MKRDMQLSLHFLVFGNTSMHSFGYNEQISSQAWFIMIL